MSTQEKKNENVPLKYNLYLDREKLNSIQFDLDNETTCDKILIQHKDSLSNTILSIYNKNIDDCVFLIIETKINKKNDDIPTLMEFKINKKTRLYDLLQNPQNNLYFVSRRKSNKEDRIKARNESITKENFFESAETNYFVAKNTEEYLPKTLFHLYDPEKQTFNKERGNVDKQKITIYKSNTNKESIEISIKDIIKYLFYSDSSQAPYKKNLPIKGEKPKFYIEIITNKTTYFFGYYKENFFFQWENAINKAITKYNIFNMELNLNMKINSSKTSIFAIKHSIIDDCYMLNKVIFNEEKRKMFFSISPEKKICSIIMNILTYKELIIKNEYLEAWMSFKQILTYIDPGNNQAQLSISIPKDEIILKIFSQEKINTYKKISEASYENFKKINMVNASLSLFKIEVKRALNEILKDNLFDDVFISLYKIYIIPFFKEVKNTLEKGTHPLEKPLIRQKFQFLLAIYFNKSFNTSVDNYNDLYSNINNQLGLIKTETLSNEIIC